MFELFSERARHTIVLAQEEARRLNHGYLGTEHLLLAMTDDSSCGAAVVLEALGLSLRATHMAVDEAITPGASAPDGHIPFTRPAKHSLERAADAARDLGHDYIGTEHLLLGLAEVGGGTASTVLGRSGLKPARVREAVSDFAARHRRDRPAGGPYGL